MSNLHFCCLILCFAVLALFEVESRRQRTTYHMFSLDKICPLSGKKREIDLRTGAAVFTLSERDSGETRRLLHGRDLSCHLEVEAPSGYGFHVFIEELSLDEGGGVVNQGCEDYVQFGRDILYITTVKSPEFCGQRRAVTFHNMTPADAAMSVKQGQRWYVEETDNEMDIWIKVGRNKMGNDRNKPNRPAWRQIVLVVTVFKKGCGSKDLFYKQCKHSSYCIRSDFFCDLRANCAWPSGEMATDEAECEGYMAANYANGKSFLLTPSSIPILLIIAIIILVGLAGIVIAIKRFVLGTPPPEAYSEVRTFSAPPSASRHNEQGDLAPSDHVQFRPEASAPPPSYEDVVKSGQMEAADKPPPYSEGEP